MDSRYCSLTGRVRIALSAALIAVLTCAGCALADLEIPTRGAPSRSSTPRAELAATPPAELGASSAAVIEPLGPSVRIPHYAERRVHVVKTGESLDHIAQRNRVSPKELISMNPGIDTTRLRVGLALHLPSARPAVRNITVAKGAPQKSRARTVAEVRRP
ncbi:MAG: LysM peptidoglycan-binding domain-containing protein [Planctomycetota bacterium]